MVKVIQRSLAVGTDNYITTIEADYARIIHAELLTHRVFSRNSGSSRAEPSMSIISRVQENPYIPKNWCKNKSGMQAGNPLSPEDAEAATAAWLEMRDAVVKGCSKLQELKVHKQWANRPLEAFSFIRVVITSTEWDNFFELRAHEDAQPEFEELARDIKAAIEQAPIVELSNGEWHTPYVTSKRENGELRYYNDEGEQITEEQALLISASCCAQLSYRKNNTSLEKAQDIYKLLIESTPKHQSPVEHQATPVGKLYKKGITHTSKGLSLWSGNFRGWIQYRQILA